MHEVEFTWPCYAGHLNATHIGEFVCVGEERGRLVEIRYSMKHHTIMLMLTSWPERAPITLRVDPREVIKPWR